MRRLLVVAALAIAAHAAAQTEAIGEITASSDADEFHALRLRGGAFFDYASPFQYAGAAVQATHYSQNGWTDNAPAALFLWRRQNRNTLAGTIAEAGIARVSGRIRPVADATWSLRPSPRTGFEVVAAADLVETRQAIEDATAYTFVAADVEHQFTQRFTAIALGGFQHFTDGNDRLHARARLIWQLVPSEGINAQLRYRQYRSDDIAASYFNPRRYRQWDGGLFIRRRHAGWIWFGTLAAGRETIDGDTQRTTGNFELRAEGPLPHDMRLAIVGSYNRSAGFAISDRYWYSVGGVTLIIPIR